jgi:hypothetical protein
MCAMIEKLRMREVSVLLFFGASASAVGREMHEADGDHEVTTTW